MSCHHEWVKAHKDWHDYVCSKCGMDLSVNEYEAVQQARREGWDQAKRECMEIAIQIFNQEYHSAGYYLASEKIADAIDALEYKEAENGL